MCTENPGRQRQKRCLLETANTCTQKLRTRPCGVFAVLVTPCDHRGPMGLVGEASPDKWGSLHNSESLEWAMCILCNEVGNAKTDYLEMRRTASSRYL